jgi:DNA-binding NarL/FixJ family response regulator
VLIIDEDARVLAGLIALLADTDGLVVAGTSGDASQTVQLAARLAPDVVLLGLPVPEHETGLPLLQQLRRRELAVVVLSARGGLRGQALHAGAATFLEKGCQPDAIIAALRHSAPGSTGACSP